MDERIGFLVEKMATNESTAEARFALLGIVSCGSNAVPALAAAIGHGEVCAQVLEALRMIGPEAEEAIPVLMHVMTCGAPESRDAARNALAAIGPNAIPCLMRVVRTERNSQTRINAALALAQIGAAAVPVTIELLQNGSTLQRKWACKVLKEMGAAATDSVPVLIDVLLDGDEDLHTGAYLALASIGSKASEAVAVLTDALESPEHSRHRYRIVAVLGAIGPDASMAIPALTRIMWRSRYSYLRQYARKALESIEMSNSFE
jgi:HEAT repeat protein